MGSGKTDKKKIVTIGGGTGTFVVLSGLRKLPDVILSAIVSTLDDGGSTGRLRDAYGFLPHGDARQALVALANGKSPLMRELFAYRFSKGDIAGHNFGNLFLTALTDILGSDAKAIEEAANILRVKGYVIPVSEKPGTLVATLENGETVVGEHLIDTRTPGRSAIAQLSTKEPTAICEDAKRAIAEADMIILGPGDLYASTLANFAIVGMKEAVSASKAKLVYIVNLFTKAGETDGYTAKRHVDEIVQYTGRKPDAVVIHNGAFARDVLAYYGSEKEYPVVDDLGDDARVIRAPFASVVTAEKVAGDTVPRSFIRHDSDMLAAEIEKLLSL
ncbi:MAG: YvcK family protein [Patescibacteria group bacterium]|nr:YvcK family protein [Patescibacteria group bacterium]